MLAAEAQLQASAAGNAAIGNPWGEIDQARWPRYRDFYIADRYSLPSGELFNYATTLVRAAAERAKPNGERLPGYSDSALPLLEKKAARRSARSTPGSTR